jgi:hypothetical protein
VSAGIAAAAVVPFTAGAAFASGPNPTPVVCVVEHGGQKAIEVGRFNTVEIGRYNAKLSAEDFSVIASSPRHGAPFYLEYAPRGEASGYYLKVDARGATLVRGTKDATAFTEGKVRAGFAALSTSVGRGRHASIEYLTDSHGRLVLARVFGHQQPTTWELINPATPTPPHM